eukprot:scaffold1049_cov168-Amphora_coffeaeformis.AAC.5
MATDSYVSAAEIIVLFPDLNNSSCATAVSAENFHLYKSTAPRMSGVGFANDCPTPALVFSLYHTILSQQGRPVPLASVDFWNPTSNQHPTPADLTALQPARFNSRFEHMSQFNKTNERTTHAEKVMGMKDSKSMIPKLGEGSAGIKKVIKAIKMLPNEKTVSYFKAVDRCPDILEGECSLHRFLSYTDHEFWRAAEYIASSWECREKMFGGRAFLPLTLASDGALSKEDVRAVQTGLPHVDVNHRKELEEAEISFELGSIIETK